MEYIKAILIHDPEGLTNGDLSSTWNIQILEQTFLESKKAAGYPTRRWISSKGFELRSEVCPAPGAQNVLYLRGTRKDLDLRLIEFATDIEYAVICLEAIREFNETHR